MPPVRPTVALSHPRLARLPSCLPPRAPPLSPIFCRLSVISPPHIEPRTTNHESQNTEDGRRNARGRRPPWDAFRDGTRSSASHQPRISLASTHLELAFAIALHLIPSVRPVRACVPLIACCMLRRACAKVNSNSNLGAGVRWDGVISVAGAIVAGIGASSQSQCECQFQLSP
ncbi:hypothetical protein DENSPDRAFT_695124 [Dentipellis sp. KUC8613]|nr:hypothetical protein DENSPDRAFT_695124 [Dentipellis sp. KUC8613]